MRKITLLLGVAFFIGTASFAGDGNKEACCKGKKEACAKGKKSASAKDKACCKKDGSGNKAEVSTASVTLQGQQPEVQKNESNQVKPTRVFAVEK